MRIEIELADATAKAAQAAGLLTPVALAQLLDGALRRQQVMASLLGLADEVAAAEIAPMAMTEILAEIKTARRERQCTAGT